jgi:hypothetical protein
MQENTNEDSESSKFKFKSSFKDSIREQTFAKVERR